FIDSETQKTIAGGALDSLLLAPGPGIFAKEEFAISLRENVPQPRPQFKHKHDLRKQIFQQLAQGQLFENYPIFAPLFFKQSATIFDYLPQNSFVTELNRDQGRQEWELNFAQWEDEYQYESAQNDSQNILPTPDFLARKNFLDHSLK